MSINIMLITFVSEFLFSLKMCISLVCGVQMVYSSWLLSFVGHR